MNEIHIQHDRRSALRAPRIEKSRALPVSLVLLALLFWCTAALPAFAAKAAPLEGVVNVNIASPEELQVLPGIGESRARAIVAERESRGGFKSVDELLEVKGIGETMLVRLRPYVSLSGKSTAGSASQPAAQPGKASGNSSGK